MRCTLTSPSIDHQARTSSMRPVVYPFIGFLNFLCLAEAITVARRAFLAARSAHLQDLSKTPTTQLHATCARVFNLGQATGQTSASCTLLRERLGCASLSLASLVYQDRPGSWIMPCVLGPPWRSSSKCTCKAPSCHGPRCYHAMRARIRRRRACLTGVMSMAFGRGEGSILALGKHNITCLWESSERWWRPARCRYGTWCLRRRGWESTVA